MKTCTLETERLILRPFVVEDTAAMQLYAGNYENIKYMIWGPNTEAETRAFIESCIKAAEEEPRLHYDFAVTLKESGKLIGGSGIYLDEGGEQGTLGWVLHMDYWKHGYGTEFAGALIKFGFEKLKLHRIRADAYAENYGSYRVMERNHMRREAYLIQNRKGRVCDPQPWYDEVQYAILRSEWEEFTR